MTPITEIMIDAIKLKAYEKLIQTSCNIPNSNKMFIESYKKIAGARLEDAVEKLKKIYKNFNNSVEQIKLVPGVVENCINYISKVKSLLKFFNLLNCQMAKRENLIKSLAESNKYITRDKEEYALIYNPFLNGDNLADIKAPNEREVI